MARVIAEAKDNPDLWRKRITCTGYGWQQVNKPCGRLIEIDATDVLQRHHRSYGEAEIYYGFICPCCGCFTQITGEIPLSVRSMATEYKT